VTGEIVFADLAAQARVVAPLFVDARDRESVVVVRRVDQASAGQREDLLAYRSVELTGIALLEVGAATAADQQAVPRKRAGLVVQHIGQATIRVAGRCANAEPAGTEFDTVSMLEEAVGALGAARARQRDAAAQAFAQ